MLKEIQGDYFLLRCLFLYPWLQTCDLLTEIKHCISFVIFFSLTISKNTKRRGKHGFFSATVPCLRDTFVINGIIRTQGMEHFLRIQFRSCLKIQSNNYIQFVTSTTQLHQRTSFLKTSSQSTGRLRKLEVHGTTTKTQYFEISRVQKSEIPSTN